MEMRFIAPEKRPPTTPRVFKEAVTEFDSYFKKTVSGISGIEDAVAYFDGLMPNDEFFVCKSPRQQSLDTEYVVLRSDGTFIHTFVYSLPSCIFLTEYKERLDLARYAKTFEYVV